MMVLCLTAGMNSFLQRRNLRAQVVAVGFVVLALNVEFFNLLLHLLMLLRLLGQSVFVGD